MRTDLAAEPRRDRAAGLPIRGRERELDELTTALGLPASGSGRAAAVRGGGPTQRPQPGVGLVAGDAGVGKTRVLAELVTRAEAAGWRSLVGHCLDFGDSALPYLPFSELLGQLSTDDPALADRLVAEHPALVRLQPGRRLLSGADRDEGVERAELFEAVHAALQQLAQDTPLLIVVEDVHWADQSTRDLLSFLFTRRFAAPLAVAASYRTDDLHRRHPLRAVAAQWGRLPGVHRLQLGPLADDAVRDLVRARHPRPLEERELRAIVERAEGNAFFAEELAEAADCASGASAPRSGRGNRLPDDLADLLLVRLDALDDPTTDVVRAAACAGRRVSHAQLAAVVDLDPVALEEALRSAVEHHVLVAVDERSYAFRHALLAEAVYTDLLPGERVRRHAAYAAALARGDVEGTAAELAGHARAAHDQITALTASVRAGDEAMRVGGPDEAARHYELALELLGSPSAAGLELDRVGLATRTADALLAAGHPYRALALVEDQLSAQEGRVGGQDRARLLIALAQAATMVDLPADSTVSSLAATTEALGLVPADAGPLRAQLLAVHARASADHGSYEDAVRWAVEAQQLAERLGLTRVAADAATTAARVEERTGNPDESQRVFEKIVAAARADGDGFAEVRGLHHLGSLHFEAGRLREAAEAYAQASRRATEMAQPWGPYGLDARVMAALTAYIAGDWDRAAMLADVAGQAAPGLAEAALTAVRLEVLAGRGDPGGEAAVDRLRPWWFKDGMVGVLGGAAAVDLLGERDPEAGLRVHDDVVEAVTPLWETELFLARVRLSALAIGQLGHGVSTRPGAAAGARARWAARADELLRAGLDAVARAERRGRSMGPEGEAWLTRLRAEHLRLRWLLDPDGNPVDPAELAALWRRSAEEFARFGHVFEAARSRARLAAVLDAAGRRDEAADPAAQAREAAEALGAAPLLAEIAALTPASRPAGTGAPQPSGPRSSTTRTAGGDLTPREREILALVAAGLSNGEIGRRLFISTKTVSVHVSRILAKLGASGRTQAAAFAREQGMLPD